MSTHFWDICKQKSVYLFLNHPVCGVIKINQSEIEKNIIVHHNIFIRSINSKLPLIDKFLIRLKNVLCYFVTMVSLEFIQSHSFNVILLAATFWLQLPFHGLLIYEQLNVAHYSYFKFLGLKLVE